MTGRPSSFTPEIGDEICRRIANDESLLSICSSPNMPATTTVYRWRDSNPQFRDDYARARVDQAHTVADSIGDIRKMILSGEIDAQAGAAAAKIAQWEASRRSSRDYGDKQLIGSDPENPLPSGFSIRLVRSGDETPLLEDNSGEGAQ